METPEQREKENSKKWLSISSVAKPLKNRKKDRKTKEMKTFLGELRVKWSYFLGAKPSVEQKK
jgi:hypothetical protein